MGNREGDSFSAQSVNHVGLDKVVDRHGTQALKFDSNMMRSIFGTDDLWPSWVADMDFSVAPAITQALAARVRHEVFGYESRSGNLVRAVVNWCRQRHDWQFEGEQLLFSPRTLNSIAVLINLFSQERDGIIVQSPVFYDFKAIIANSRRKLVKNPLRFDGERYQIDFDDLETKASSPNNRMLILCNPHNPLGRVWSRKELEEVARICLRHDVLVIADEIHGDIVYGGYHYTPFATLSPEVADITFSCISPAKSFNIASNCNSMIVITNKPRRVAVADYYNRMEINKNNAFANVAMEAAYTHGGPWLDTVLGYLEENLAFLREYLTQHIPVVKLVEPEGTFLAWLDFRALGMDAKTLERFLIEQARLALNPGHWFGREGAGFARLNIACPRSELERALHQLQGATSGLSRG